MRRPATAQTLLLLALIAPARLAAADSSWDDPSASTSANANANTPPSGYTLSSDGTGAPALLRQGAEVVLSCEPAKYCHLDTELSSDGSDQQPLRIECTLALEAGTAVTGAPLLLSLRWSGGALVAVGLGDGGGERSSRHWANRAWTAGVVDGKGEASASGLATLPGSAPVHVRLVVVSHAISAYASADGWTWTRIHSWTRTAEFSGAPARLAVGRGWIGAKSGLDNDTAGAGPPCRYRIGHLHLASGSASVPAELMKSYTKKDSREETLDDLEAAGLVHSWSILGPLPAKDGGYGFEADAPTTALAPVGKLGWKTFVPEDGPSDRILLLSAIAPGLGENALRYAAAIITASERRQERFLFDGERDVTLFLNGVELAQDWHDGAVEEDRLCATGTLEPGDNRLLVRLGAGKKGAALLTLRHLPGDPLYQIALLRRLAIDFPDDSDANLQGLEEIARLWEGLGFQMEAVNAYADLAKDADASADQVDAALMEKTRLDRELGNDAQVTSDVAELTKRWADSSDPTTAQLKVARLWERMGQPDQAASALTRASTLAGGDHQQLLDIALERAVIHQGNKDPAAVIADLQAGVAALPAQDPRHSEMQVTLAEHQQRLGTELGTLLTQALAGASARDLRRITALAVLTKDQPGAIAARTRSLTVSPDTVDAPGFALAQLEAGANAYPAAHDTELRALWRLPGAATPEVQARLAQLGPATAGNQAGGKAAERFLALEGIAVEASLRSSEDGATLLAQMANPQDGLNALPSGPPDWHLAAPIPGGKNPWHAWDDGYLRSVGIGAGAINFDQGIEDVDWRLLDPSSFEGGVLDLKALLGNGGGGGGTGIGNATALLATDLTVDRDFATALNLGADDALKVVLNGKVVYGDKPQTKRRFAPDAVHVPVNLVKGANHLLVLAHHGGGPWRLQIGIEGATPVAAALAPALGSDPSRAGTVKILVALAEHLARDGKPGQAGAVARTVLICYPDQPEAQLSLVLGLRDAAVQANDVALVMGLEDWSEASAALLDPTRDQWRLELAWKCAELMQNSGRTEAALDLLECTLRSQFQSERMAETLRRIGELYRLCGFSHLATSTFTKALSLGMTDGAWITTVHRELARARPPKGAHGASDTTFELNNQMRMAEQAVSAKDYESAITAFQKAIEETPGQLCLTADGHLRSAGSYASECLRALDPAGQKIYSDHYESRAQGQLDSALAHHDLEACERIAATFPLTHAAALALASAGDGYAGRGCWALADGTWERLLEEYTLSPAETLTAIERLADAAARAHDHRGLAIAQATLASAAAGRSASQASVPVDGRQVPIQTWLQGLTAALASAATTPAPALPPRLHASVVTTYPCPPDELFDLCRIRRMDGPQVLFAPALAGPGGGSGSSSAANVPELLALSCLSGTRVIDLASATTRWSDAPEYPQLRASARWGGFAGAPENQACLVGGLVLARVLRGGAAVIEARDAATGALAWSTEGGPLAAKGFLASSSPAAGEDRIFACFSASGQELLVALALADGHQLWQSLVSMRRPGLTVQASDDILLDGYLAPPLVLGRQVLVAPDLGELLSVDAGTGAIDWSASYVRGNFDPADTAAPATAILAMRSPTRVIAAGDDRLLIAPRDSLSILAFTRSGALAWSREAASGRHLAGVSADGQVAVSEWLDVEAISTQDGSLRWRFQPRAGDGQCTGHALILGTEVLVPTDHALYRLSLSDGTQLSRQGWDSMGLTGAVAPWLVATNHGLYGVGNHQLVLYDAAPATAPATPPALIPPATAADVLTKVPLPSAGLPAAPAGSPLAIDWRLAGDAVRAIDTPPGTPSGTCFVRFAHALALIDPAHHLLLWKTRIAADTRAVIYSPELALCLHPTGVVALERATGIPRWTTVVTQGVLDGMQMRTIPPPVMWLGEQLLITDARLDRNSLQVFSLADGRALGAVQIDGVPIAAGDFGGKLWILVHRRDRLVMDWHDPANLGARQAADALIPASDHDGAVVDGGSVVLHNKTQVVRYDLATHTSHPFPLMGNLYDFYEDQGHPLLFVHGLDNRWTSAVLDGHDQVVVSDLSSGGDAILARYGIYADHVNGQHLVRFDADRKGKSGILARSLSDGKEQWWLENRDRSHRFGNGLAMLDHFAIAASSDIEGVMRYRLIDCDSGKEVAGGPIPGWAGDSLMPMQVLGGEWLYGTEQGLVCMQPTTAAAAGQPAADGALPQLALSHELPVVAAPGPMVVDGHLDDWGTIAPALLQVPGAARSGGGPAVPLAASAAVRLCSDSDGLYIAVQLLDPQVRTASAAQSVLSADGLLIGIDPRNAPWRASVPVMAALSLVDGETRLTIDGKAEPTRGTDPNLAHARIARTAQGLTYELMVPWSDLHLDPTQLAKNRTLAIDLLATCAIPGEKPRGLELGWGLAEGWDPSCWQGLQLALPTTK